MGIEPTHNGTTIRRVNHFTTVTIHTLLSAIIAPRDRVYFIIRFYFLSIQELDIFSAFRHASFDCSNLAAALPATMPVENAACRLNPPV